MLDAKTFVAELAALTKTAIAKAVEPLQQEITTLKASIADIPAPLKGDKGDQGPAVSGIDLAAAVDAAVQIAVKDFDERVTQRIAAFPIPENGQPGKDAAPVPSAFLISEEGELVSVYPDGEKQIIGKVRGTDGKRGASVMDGSVDEAGQLTLRMSDGRVVNVGLVRGKDGQPGVPGKPGAGRDAAELVIMPGIDEQRSYPEGTCATHRGGTIRAFRQTDPIDGAGPDVLRAAGWSVLLEGICEETEEALDGGREVQRSTTYTSGKTVTRNVQTAAMIYRGVWKETDYARGDTVTQDGSTWHCERPTKGRPGMGDDWRLMTKRGRDGKDATKH